MLKHVMAVAAVSTFALTQRAGAANVAARIFAAPGRVDEHTVKPERVDHDTVDSDGQVRHQAVVRSVPDVQVQGH